MALVGVAQKDPGRVGPGGAFPGLGRGTLGSGAEPLGAVSGGSASGLSRSGGTFPSLVRGCSEGLCMGHLLQPVSGEPLDSWKVRGSGYLI